MDTTAQPLALPHLKASSLRARISGAAATLGIIIMTLGMNVPFAGRDIMFHGTPPQRSTETWTLVNGIVVPFAGAVGRMVFAQLGLLALGSVLVWGGLALVPLLWLAFGPRGSVRVRWLYATWLVLLTLAIAIGVPVVWHSAGQPIPGNGVMMMAAGAPYLLPSAVVFPLGALLGFGALGLMLREPLPVALPARQGRTRGQLIAAVTLSAGVVIWLVGFYLMPQAVTAACPPVTISVTQFAHGACAGIDSDQVLSAASNTGLGPVGRTFFSIGWNFELLVAAGFITALGGWTRRLTAGALWWLAAWPVAATGVAVVALSGAEVVARQGFKLTSATGPGWHVASGMFVTFAGIALVVLAELILWRELARRLNRGAGV